MNRVQFIFVGCFLLLLAAVQRADAIGPSAPIVSSLQIPLAGVANYKPPSPNCAAAAEAVTLTGNVHVVSLLAGDLSELSLQLNLDNVMGVGAVDGLMFVGDGAVKVTRDPGPPSLPSTEPLQVLATFVLKDPGPSGCSSGLNVMLLLLFNADGTLSAASTAAVGAGITPGP
jgi:hypothetical protein